MIYLSEKMAYKLFVDKKRVIFFTFLEHKEFVMESTQFLQEEKHRYSHYFKDICTYASCIRKRHEFFFDLYIKINKILKSTLKNAPFLLKLKEVNRANSSEVLAPGIGGSQTNNMRNLFIILDTIIALSNEFLSCMNVEIFNVFKSMNKYEKDLIKAEKMKVDNNKSQRKAALLAYRSKQKQLADLYAQIEKENQNIPVNSSKLKTMLCRYFSILTETKLSLTELNLLHSKYVKSTEESINRIRVSVVQHVTEMKSIFFSTVPFIINYTKRIDIYVDLLEKMKPSLDSNWESDFTKFIMSQKLYRTPKSIQLFNYHTFSFVDEMFMRPSLPLFCHYEGIPLFIGTATEKYTPQQTNQFSIEANEKVFIYENPVYEFVLASKPKENIFGYIPTKILKISKDEKIFMTIRPQLKTANDKMEFRTAELIYHHGENDNNNQKSILCENIDGTVCNADILNILE